MALGGGLFITQNKVLPGTYMNFVSASKATTAISERGIAAMPMQLAWGKADGIFTVTGEEFRKDSLKIFGYSYDAPEMEGLRDLFLHIREGHFYKLNQDAVKASCIYGTAKYAGTRGNQIKIVIQENEASEEEAKLYDVETYFAGVLVDQQLAIATMTDLKANDYVDWSSEASLAVTAATMMTGGTDGTVVNGNYQTFLDKLESYTFHVVGTTATDDEVKGLFANWTKRMRDEVGVKFQCVLYRYPTADHEGIVSVENKLVGEVEDSTETARLVYWVTGAMAGCEVNQSLTNMTYDGEFAVDVDYTQRQLEEGMTNGKFMFHKVNDEVRVLDDRNTWVSYHDEKSEDFANNQVVRVLDQIGNDIAALFHTKYLGKVPNDNAGRISLWNDIVTHHQQLEKIRAIENFEPEQVKVEASESKKAVVVMDYITPVNAMAQLYMTVVVA